MESALLIPHLTTAGVAMEATVMASVQLMLRLPLTMAGEAMDMASDLLMLMPTTSGEAMAATDMARDPLMLMPTTAGEAMAATDMASALLTPLPTTAGEAMAATATESRFLQPTETSNCLDLNLYWKAKFYSFSSS